MKRELIPQSAIIFRLQGQFSGFFKIELTSDILVDVYIVDEANAEALRKSGDFLKTGTIYSQDKSVQSLIKTVGSGIDAKFVAIVNSSPSKATYALEIDEICTTSTTPAPTSGVTGISGYYTSATNDRS